MVERQKEMYHPLRCDGDLTIRWDRTRTTRRGVVDRPCGKSDLWQSVRKSDSQEGVRGQTQNIRKLTMNYVKKLGFCV